MARIAVIGGGVSGLSFAWRMKELKPGWEIIILEKTERAGGKVWTVSEEGFVWERGVNGFLDNKPATLDLARQLGIEPLKSNDAARRRFVVKNNGLLGLPESPGAFLRSKLLSPSGKLRILLEPFIRKGDPKQDESLAAFARRRLGKEALDCLIDPMATGIYAGDPEKLSLKACFPRIHELEQGYGSLIRAMIALKKEAKLKGKAGPGAGPGGKLTSFARGMSVLVDTLYSRLKDIVRLNTPVISVIKQGDGFSVVTADGAEIPATHVVMACPAKAASHILSDGFPSAAEAASAIQYPPVSITALGIKEGTGMRPLDGFGFLCPAKEGRRIMGSLWDSSIFPARAPEGYNLIRVLVGGARAPDLAGLPDDALLKLVLDELKALMGLKVRPEFVRIFRWKEAIPQYNIGHSALIRKILEGLGNTRIKVRCNWAGGVSLNDCVTNADSLAREMASSNG
jgi:oxygen-dependent protoporphyrinogen oxidase